MLFRPVLGIVCALPAVLGAVSEASALDALKGNSIVAERTEQLVIRGQTIRQVWRVKVYVSAAGRIFHDHRVDSEGEFGVAFQSVDGKDTDGGRRAVFRWDPRGALVRQWVNPRGIQVYHAIEVTGGPGNASCVMTVDRPNRRGGISVLAQSCRIVEGNVFGRV